MASLFTLLAILNLSSIDCSGFFLTALPPVLMVGFPRLFNVPCGSRLKSMIWLKKYHQSYTIMESSLFLSYSTYTRTLSLSPCLSLSLILHNTHTQCEFSHYFFLSLLFNNTHTHTTQHKHHISNSLFLFLSLTHTLTLFLSLSLTLSRTQTQTLSQRHLLLEQRRDRVFQLCRRWWRWRWWWRKRSVRPSTRSWRQRPTRTWWPRCTRTCQRICKKYRTHFILKLCSLCFKNKLFLKLFFVFNWRFLTFVRFVCTCHLHYDVFLKSSHRFASQPI